MPIKDNITPAEAKREDIKNAVGVTDSGCAAPIAFEYRDCHPKRMHWTRRREGANPATLYDIVTSPPIPQDHVMQLYMLLHDMNIYDHPTAGVTNILADTIILVDLEPVLCSFIDAEGVVRNAAGNLSLLEAEGRVYPLDYYVSQGAVLSLFTLTQYVGGGPAPPFPTSMVHSVFLYGRLIHEPTQSARGTGEAIPVANAANWVAALAKYGAW